jgi:hypothetical protein
MGHSCRYLCSEIVKVIYEDQPGEVYQIIGNLEEISASNAVVLLENRPRLGSPISLEIKGRDLFGVITSSVYDATLGWFITVTLDAASSWRRDSIAPQHLLALCDCSSKKVRRAKVHTLESDQNTEENVPVSFLARRA